jgi:hypothetical protein
MAAVETIFLAGIATLAVGLWQSAIVASFAGVGLAAFRALGAPASRPRELFLAAWLGFAVVLFLLIAWSLVAPIDWRPSALVAAAAGAGLARERGLLGEMVGAIRQRPGWLCLAVALGGWIANQSLGPNDSWDGALYHQQVVRWALAHPAIPGLANLYGPLAFNNANLLYAAAVDLGSGLSSHAANGALCLLAALQALGGAARLRDGTAAGALDLCLLAPALHLTMQDGRTFDPSVAATLLLLTGAGALWWSWRRDLVGVAALARRENATVVLLLAAAVATKASSGVFAALLCVIGAIRLIGVRRRAAWAVATPAVVLASIAGALWTARTVVLSGYPAWPSAFLPFPAGWRAPIQQAHGEWENIAFTERGMAFEIGERWIGGLLGQPYFVVVPLALGGFAVAAIATRRARPGSLTRAAAFGVASAGAIALWLFTAPALRYAGGFFWATALVATAEFATLLDTRSRARLAAGLMLLGFSPLIVQPAISACSTWNVACAVEIARANLVVTTTLSPSFPPRGYRTYSTASGLQLHVPRKHCGGAPLPCTPNPARNLRLREPGEIRSGFAIDGHWQPEDFPVPWRADFLERLERHRASQARAPAD